VIYSRIRREEPQKWVIRRNYGDPMTPWFIFLRNVADDNVAYFASSNQETFQSSVEFMNWANSELAKGVRYIHREHFGY
jgi:hypothetical protein